MLLSCPCSDESVCGVGRRYATAALSGAARQLSQRESLWRVGPLPTGRLRPDRTQKGGPCYRGQARLRTTSQSHSVRQCRVAAPSVCCAAACIPLAAAPTAPPCFGHWPRSSPLPLVGVAKRRSFPLCQSLPYKGRWHGVSRDGEVVLRQSLSCVGKSGSWHRFLYLFGEVYDILVLRPCPPILLGRG